MRTKYCSEIQAFLALAAVGPVLIAAVLYAAVGCDLNDPDRDAMRLCLKSTGFKAF
jgi:hypothetical protein